MSGAAVETIIAGAGGKVQQVVLPGQTPAGQHVLSVLIKRSYKIIPGGKCVRAEKDQKLFPGDVHYEDPMNSSVKFESDYIPYKIATDVVFNGKAYAPHGIATPSLTASVIVGAQRKDILVLGDRVCQYVAGGDPVFTEPEPFTEMEIRYERAYGGVDVFSDPKVPVAYARNHLGRGFVIKNEPKTIQNFPLPNLEDTNHQVTPEMLCTRHFIAWERQPLPQSFGWVAKQWQPRSALAGVMPADRAAEQELRQIYTQIVPPEQREMYAKTQLPDMDFRFFNGAQPELTLPFLEGAEEIKTVNLTPDGDLNFFLPSERPRVKFDIGFGVKEPEIVLHTVMIRMEDGQVDLVWRTASEYPGPDWLPLMRKMEVFVQ